jgi:hypothetical protein
MTDVNSENGTVSAPEDMIIQELKGEQQQVVAEDPVEIASRQERREKAGRIANRYELAEAFRIALTIGDADTRRKALSDILDIAASPDNQFKLLPSLPSEKERVACVALAEDWFKNSDKRYGDIDTGIATDEQCDKARAYADITTLGYLMKPTREISNPVDFARQKYHRLLSHLVQGGEDESEFGDDIDFTNVEATLVDLPNQDEGSDMAETLGSSGSATAPSGKGSWSSLIPADTKGTGWAIPSGGPASGWNIPSDNKGDWQSLSKGRANGGGKEDRTTSANGGK